MNKRWTILLEIVLLAGVCAWVGYAAYDPPPEAGAISIKVQLRNARDKAWIVKRGESLVYVITRGRGKHEEVSPEEFTHRVYDGQTRRGPMAKLLNVATPIGFLWVTLGFMGQVLFTGRMLVQWLASEKHGKSVVPPAFWWMSLTGATMLLIYFVWRKDPVGVLGQAFGWFIYLKNLWLIYGKERAEVVAPVPASAGAPDGAA